MVDPDLIRGLAVGQAAYIYRGGVTYAEVKRLVATSAELPAPPPKCRLPLAVHLGLYLTVRTVLILAMTAGGALAPWSVVPSGSPGYQLKSNALSDSGIRERHGDLTM